MVYDDGYMRRRGKEEEQAIDKSTFQIIWIYRTINNFNIKYQSIAFNSILFIGAIVVEWGMSNLEYL